MVSHKFRLYLELTKNERVPSRISRYTFPNFAWGLARYSRIPLSDVGFTEFERLHLSRHRAGGSQFTKLQGAHGHGI